MTTPDAVKAMVEALRRAAYHKGVKRAITENCFCGSCAKLVGECDVSDRLRPARWCNGPAARAALDVFEKRTPLRDDPEMLTILRAVWTDKMGIPDATDALDLALFGERG